MIAQEQNTELNNGFYDIVYWGNVDYTDWDASDLENK